MSTVYTLCLAALLLSAFTSTAYNNRQQRYKGVLIVSVWTLSSESQLEMPPAADPNPITDATNRALADCHGANCLLAQGHCDGDHDDSQSSSEESQLRITYASAKRRIAALEKQLEALQESRSQRKS
jgi:hypothetical protein